MGGTGLGVGGGVSHGGVTGAGTGGAAQPTPVVGSQSGSVTTSVGAAGAFGGGLALQDASGGGAGVHCSTRAMQTPLQSCAPGQGTGSAATAKERRHQSMCRM